MPLNLPVILGSVRQNRIGIRVARYMVNALRRRGHEALIIDPVEYPLPLLDCMYKEYSRGEAPEMLERLADRFRAADDM